MATHATLLVADSLTKCQWDMGEDLAIQGNNNPDSIGGYVSSGCVRMHDSEVEWLFHQVPVNTPVIITTSGNSFDSIAAFQRI